MENIRHMAYIQMLAVIVTNDPRDINGRQKK